MPAKSLLCSVILCFFTAYSALHAQVDIENFEFAKHERLLLITGTSSSDKAIIDLFVTLEGGESSHLGGLEVTPMDNTFGFSLGLTNQAKWPQGSYQIAVTNFYDPMDVAYANVIKGIGDPDFSEQSTLIIFPFINTHWIPTLDEPFFPEEWVKPCPSHVLCTVIEGPNMEPFSPPLPVSDDDDDNSGS